MSDSDNKKTGIIVLHPVPPHQALAKSSRWRLRLVILMMSLMVVTGFWLMPSKRFFDSYASIAALEAQSQSPQSLSAEVATLKGQLVGIVSGSIESKLSTLEQSLRTGAVNTSLGAIQDLKNDVKLLRSYSAAEPSQQTSNNIGNQQLIEEMSHLKRLIYLTIASCGLMLAAFTGIWLRNLKKLPYQEKITRFLGRP
ncbi:hypothetical protein JCM14076_07530 [Methylosoma difficile]